MSKSIEMVLFPKSGAKFFPASPRPHRFDEFAVRLFLGGLLSSMARLRVTDRIHLRAAGSYLSTRSFGKISKLDSKARTRQNINIGGGPNQSIEVGHAGISNSQLSLRASELPR